jgi:uncharacterized membrane protein YgaE (UPF0421/DUF939 family)
MKLSTFMPGLQLALRTGLSAGLSLAIAYALKMEHPVYAMIAAIIVTDLAPSRSRHLGWHRALATVLGAVCGGVFSLLVSPNPWTVGIGIIVAMLISHVLQGPDGVRVAAFVFAIIVIEHSDDPWHFALHRFLETMLGIAVAWSISHVPKLINVPDPAREQPGQEQAKQEEPKEKLPSS